MRELKEGDAMASRIYEFMLRHLDTLHSIVFNMGRLFGYLRLPTYSLAFRYALSTIRAGLWSARVGKMGKGVRIDSDVIIRGNPKNLEIGDHSYVGMGVLFHIKGPIRIGKYVEIASGTTIHCTLSGITLGNCATLSTGVRIFSSTNVLWLLDENKREKLLNAIEYSPQVLRVLKNAPVIIEDYAFIGANSVVLPGVRIGKGAVVGANSVVSKDIPPFTIAVGAPAKVMKGRTVPARR